MKRRISLRVRSFTSFRTTASFPYGSWRLSQYFGRTNSMSFYRNAWHSLCRRASSLDFEKIRNTLVSQDECADRPGYSKTSDGDDRENQPEARYALELLRNPIENNGRRTVGQRHHFTHDHDLETRGQIRGKGGFRIPAIILAVFFC